VLDIFEIGAAVVFVAIAAEVCFSAIREISRFRVARQRRDLELNVFQAKAETLIQFEQQRREQAAQTWVGKRKFRIIDKAVENASGSICSFQLVPHDGKSIPPFRAGQYLTFVLRVPGRGVVVRCYSISSSPGNRAFYQVSVKKLAPHRDADGQEVPTASGFMHNLAVGDIVDVIAPTGAFALDEISEKPLVLIGGGVGITPLMSMLHQVAEATQIRQTHLFYCARNKDDQIWSRQLQEMAELHPQIHVTMVLSQATDEASTTSRHLSIKTLQEQLGSTNYQFYVCGPSGLMEKIIPGLYDWGVPKADVNYEAFNQDLLKALRSRLQESQGAACGVRFSRSAQLLNWQEGDGTVLELAEAGNIKIPVGCRAGNCGTCVTTLKEGRVEYLRPPGFKPETGTCLACVAFPVGDIVVDA